MDNRIIELRAKKVNKSITALEIEELDIYNKLQENIAKQVTESAVNQKKVLEESAAAGDSMAQVKLEQAAVLENDKKIRQQVSEDIAVNAKKIRDENVRVSNQASGIRGFASSASGSREFASSASSSRGFVSYASGSRVV